MQAANTTRVSYGADPLDTVLRPLHDAWIEECRSFFEASFEPDANVWARWAAVRYLADEFLARYRWERALVDELRPFVGPDAAERLLAEGDGVLRLRLELDRVGRRRGTAAEFAAGARDLLEQLAVWFAEVEFAARGITRDALPEEAAGLIDHLEAALRVGR